MNITFIDPATDPRWDQFVLAHPHSSIYHHSCWLKVLHETYRYTPYNLAAADPSGRFAGILPLVGITSKITGNRLISLPFSPYGGPLANDEASARQLIHAAKDLLRQHNFKFLQLRMSWGNAIPDQTLCISDAYYRIHILDIRPDLESIQAGFHKDCIMRSIRKALKGPLRLRIAENETDVKAFYRLQVQTRKKHGIPPQPLHYFLCMWRTLYPQQRMKILLAEHGTKTAAAVILLPFKDMVVYQNGGSSPKYLGLRPNHFLLWKAIEMAKNEGYCYFNFGTSTPDEKGLMEFKCRWGARESTSVLRRMPLFVLKSIGKISYRHFA